MDFDPQNNCYTRLRGDGFQALLHDGLVEIHQDTGPDVMRVVLTIEETIDLMDALKGILEAAKKAENS